jgi:hypothetical protein
MDWNELGVVSKEEYKSYVMTILNADSIRIDDASEQRYGGSDSFGGMSKDIGRQWKQADALTKTVFKELAKENMERHKKEVYEAYKAFTKKLPDPTKTIPRLNEPRIYDVDDEVGTSDQEIKAMVCRAWSLDNVAQEELADFLSGIKWD